MRRLFYSAVVLTGSLLASAASAVTVWQGEAVVTSASGNCISPTSERRTIGAGTVLKSVLRPKGVGDNGNSTRISFIHDSGALFLMFLDNVQGGGDYAAQGVTHSGMFVAPAQIAGFSSFTQTPAVVAASTTIVRVTGRVEDFMFLPGCDATFRAAYSIR